MIKTLIKRTILPLLLLIISTGVRAEEKIIPQFDLITQYNPLALAAMIDLPYKHTYHKDDSPLWDGLYYQEGAGIMITPSYLNGSLYIEWEPIAILKFQLRYNALTYFGTYKHSFDSLDDFSDEIRNKYKGFDDKGSGQNIRFQPTFQLKYGQMIFINQSDMVQYYYNGIGPYFLVNEYDILVKKNDNIIANRTRILFEIRNSKASKLYLGPYFELVQTWDTNLKSERLGALFYIEPANLIPWLRNPRFFAQSGIYLSDANRKNSVFAIVGFGIDLGIIK